MEPKQCAFITRPCTAACMAHVDNLKEDGKMLMRSRDNAISDVCIRLYTLGRHSIK